MEIKVIRNTFTEKSTISDLYVDDKWQCYCLEDRDRRLEEDLTKKIKAHTAIPLGRYQVTRTHSPRFNKMLPLLLNVPAYEGIRIHSGNHDGNTEGCLLPGQTKSKDWVGSSVAAFKPLDELITKALAKGEKVYVTIERDEEAYEAAGI